MPERTRRGAVAVLLFAAVVAALQIGKAAIALPVLQRELVLTLAVASWIVGAYGLVGAVAGLPLGIASALVTAKRATVVGLLIAGAGSIAGAFATDGALLIATRIVEGCGFLAVSLAIPRLLRLVTAPRHLDTVMPLFGAYLPTGSVIMMFAGPPLLAFGWPVLWLVNGAVCLLAAIAVGVLTIDERPPAGESVTASALWPNIRAVCSAPGPILLALAFGAYTFQYMALSGLLPTLLVDRMGLSIAAAGVIGGLAVAANALGNMSAGLLLRLGVPTWAIVTAVFAFMGVASFGIFAAGLPVGPVALLAAASLAVTGLVPGSIHAAAPRLAASSAGLAITLGLINQVTSLGNFLGPTVIAAVVERVGWDRAAFAFATVAVVGVILGLALRRVLGRGPAG